MARIAGVSFIGIAPLTYAEGTGKPQWGDIVELPQFINFSGSKQMESTTWYSNDRTEEVFTGVTSVELSIELGRMTNEVKAMISGSEYTSKGVMVEKTDDAQPEFALVVVLNQYGAKNGKLCLVYYRCKLAIEEIAGETKTDSLSESNVSITGTAIPLADGRLGASIDSLDSKADKSIVASWTTTVFDSSTAGA